MAVLLFFIPSSAKLHKNFLEFTYPQSYNKVRNLFTTHSYKGGR